MIVSRRRVGQKGATDGALSEKVQPSETIAGRLPGNLDESIFRIAAFAFCSLSALALFSDYVGPDLHVAYPAVWAITALAFAGGAVSWYLAHRRARVELILPLALFGTVLI